MGLKAQGEKHCLVGARDPERSLRPVPGSDGTETPLRRERATLQGGPDSKGGAQGQVSPFPSSSAPGSLSCPVGKTQQGDTCRDPTQLPQKD